MTIVECSTHADVTTITMDDGKANALSPTMFDELGAAFDAAEAADSGAVVLLGRPGRFSGGFDLGVLGGGRDEAERMLLGGFELAQRLLGFPYPVVVGCTGHALAMGLFLVCSGDCRVGASGDFKLRANEVAIGLPMPYAAVAILRYRLTPSAFDRAAGLAEAFSPSEAVAVGLLDRVVEPDRVADVAHEVASSYLSLDIEAHRETKRRARATVLAEVASGIERDFPAGGAG